MRFASPEWFLLLPPVLLLLWRERGRSLVRLRAGLLVLLVLALARPELRTSSDGLDLWVLVDRSASASQALTGQLEEWEQLLARSKGAHDRIIAVDFAAEPIRRSDEQSAFAGDPSLTRTALAVRTALSSRETGRAARILLVTDGYSTEPISDLAERLEEEGVALDYRLTSAPETTDFRVARFDAVQRVQFGEPILLAIEVAGTSDAEVPFEIQRDAVVIHRGTVSVTGGRGRIRLSDRVWEGGAHRYRVVLQAVQDNLRGNDSSSRWIEVAGGPRLLLATSYPDDPLIGVLKDQGFELDVVTDPSQLHLGKLSGAKAVILNDVPAYRVPKDFLAGLDFFVRGQGGGLLMGGGQFSFGSGGYFQSPVDALLPVSMELRQEHRKLAVAIAIVLDRSGSMSMTVPSSGGPVTKMKLADAGAARAIELLGATDQVAVFAVDSSPHRIVGLSVLGENRARLLDAVSRVESTGGGIFVYEGLSAAWAELKKSEVGQRHVILFSDANDSEEPGEYQTLLAEMVKEKTTVSVIGLGTRSDTDAALLEDIAKRGNGRIFFTDQAHELPSLFAQETVAVARSAFIDDPTGVAPTAGWLELAGRPLQWLEQVDGYNLSYLRPEASAIALSTDEYRAPLVAEWQRGVGRVAAVSFPLAGDFSARARGWKQYGDFAQTLVRWLAAGDVPPGIGVRTAVRGTELEVELLYGDAWEERLARRAPKVVIGESGEISEIPWRRVGPGRYSTSIQLPLDRAIRGAIQVDDRALSFGPVSAGASVEWDFDPARLRELRSLSIASGGTERLNLKEIWDAPRPPAFRDVSPVLLVLFVLLFLVTALFERTGLVLPSLALPKLARRRPSRRQPVESAPAEEPIEDLAADRRRRRFDRAKRK